MVQKHVNKCFEAVNQLQFDQNEMVHGIYSLQKEYVKFECAVDVNEGEKKG